MFRSIRHGLFAALAGFTVLICVGYTGLALVISYVTEDMLVDRLLAREADGIALHFRQHGEIKPPDLTLIRVYRSVADLPPEVEGAVMAGFQRAEIATDTGPHYHLRTLDLRTTNGGQRLYLVADVAPLLVVAKLFQEVGGLLTAVALGLLALALLLAYLLSRRLVAPLQVLAQEVRAATVAEPGTAVRFSASDRRDEIGYLADRLGATIGDLHAALQRETDFTRDIGHELRTPLTVMQNVLSRSGGAGAGANAGASAAIGSADAEQLREGVSEMRATVDVLFALARAEHIAAETFDLRALIEERLLRLIEDEGWDAAGLVLALPERLPATGNRHLCSLLLDNCLRNAVFHGGAGCRLQLAFADGALAIINTVAPQQPASTHGFRHGQHLLLRIAAAMRWQIAFDAMDDGYRVTITPTI
ncbi:HAMP domain-containing sensor histidine kinase [Duganella sp. FT27W]|uniref:sensor histidine kinase n=1 Tax=Duganella sp. FT27W TaxID=2654636 RepID=UPI00128B748E|nr:HAMP domain-containing histidine kinase [Duganella sp. FT27W]MPQ55629.1 hypothetical protein [Duganella sp. FT27W]